MHRWNFAVDMEQSSWIKDYLKSSQVELLRLAFPSMINAGPVALC